MRLFCLVLGLLVAVCGPSRAQTILRAPGGEGSIAQGHLCRSAIALAERGSDIPANLLAAIGRVESGRRDPVTGTVQPWPWSVNADGQGFFYDTKAEAVAAVRAMQASGVRSIDVGCGQINLMYHPNAFPDLELAFDPRTNAAYAAKFLKALYAQTGDWMKATAMYHSATPGVGAEYRQQVMAVWPEEQKVAGHVATTALAHAWGATMTATPHGFTRVVRMELPGMTHGARMIILPTPGDATSPGHGFETHRAAAVGLTYQPPAPRGAGG